MNDRKKNKTLHRFFEKKTWVFCFLKQKRKQFSSASSFVFFVLISVSFVKRVIFSARRYTLIRGTDYLVCRAVFFHSVSAPARGSCYCKEGGVHFGRNIKHLVNKA